MTDKLRLGMIGAGAIAVRHLSVLAETDGDVNLVAHLGRSPQTAATAAARFGGVGFSDLHQFISVGRPDAVIVTIPPSQHGPIEHALLDARIPFLVEKPIAIHTATAEAIAEQIERSGTVVAVGYNWRAMDTLDHVRVLIKDNPVRMAIGRFHIGTPATPWWRMEAQSGGQMLEQACHLIDLCRVLLGEGEVVGATGSYGKLPQFDDGDIAGTSAALLRFGNGIPGVVTATCLLPGNSTVELRLICDNREIVVTLAGIDVIVEGKTIHHAIRGSSYARQNRAFFDAVRSGDVAAVYSTYADALETHRLCAAIQAAVVLNRP